MLHFADGIIPAMSDPSKQGHNLATLLLIAAGAILLLAGVISLLPAVNAANEVPPQAPQPILATMRCLCARP